MKVTSVRPFGGETVSIEGEWYDYIRYGSDCWYKCYGESDTELYNEELISELEAAYQQFKQEQKNDN